MNTRATCKLVLLVESEDGNNIDLKNSTQDKIP